MCICLRGIIYERRIAFSSWIIQSIYARIMFDAEGKIRIAWISTAVVNIALAIAVMAMLTRHEVSEVPIVPTNSLLKAYETRYLHFSAISCLLQRQLFELFTR